ncbi:hypothetical protein HK099_000924 [Clydaea vesicula]|uniref:F-box domain-containing protein n=1 Tax=Clydaea vesicula TaxID=447962 RepID=A0AAD5TUV9_9FUNG|nr:hypothetical protein HK099_000924 [Clydaea vesicula]KAJ3377203.1 hypothetical protein HDU92_008526 [Lobulomyces angularis]
MYKKATVDDSLKSKQIPDHMNETQEKKVLMEKKSFMGLNQSDPSTVFDCKSLPKSAYFSVTNLEPLISLNLHLTSYLIQSVTAIEKGELNDLLKIKALGLELINASFPKSKPHIEAIKLKKKVVVENSKTEFMNKKRPSLNSESIIKNILKFNFFTTRDFYSFCLVSINWNTIAAPLLWKNIGINSDFLTLFRFSKNLQLNLELDSKKINNFQYTETLTLYENTQFEELYYNLQNQQIAAITSYFENLKTLISLGPSFSTKDLINIFNICANLEVLDLNLVNFNKEENGGDKEDELQKEQLILQNGFKKLKVLKILILEHGFEGLITSSNNTNSEISNEENEALLEVEDFFCNLNLTNLVELEMPVLNINLSKILGKNLTKLKKCVAYLPSGNCDEILINLLQNSESLTDLILFTYLNDPNKACITSKSLIKLANFGNSIKHLQFYEFDTFTGIEVLATLEEFFFILNAIGKNLIKVYNYFPGLLLTKEILIKLSENLPIIEEFALCFDESQNLDIIALESMVSNCRNLKIILDNKFSAEVLTYLHEKNVTVYFLGEVDTEELIDDELSYYSEESFIEKENPNIYETESQNDI